MFATFVRGLDSTITHLKNQPQSTSVTECINQLLSIKVLFDGVSIPSHMRETDLNKVDSFVLMTCSHSETKEKRPLVHLIQFVIQIYAFIFFQRDKSSIRVDISKIIKQFNKFLNSNQNDILEMFKVDGLGITIHALVDLPKNTVNSFTTFFSAFLCGKYVEHLKQLLEPVVVDHDSSEYLIELLSSEPISLDTNSDTSKEEERTTNSSSEIAAAEVKRILKPINLKEYSKSKSDVLLMPHLSYGLFDYELKNIEAKLLEDIEQSIPVSIICYLALVLSKKETDIRQLVVSSIDGNDTDLLVTPNAVYWRRYDVYMPDRADITNEQQENIFNSYDGCIKLRLSNSLHPILKSSQTATLSSLVSYTKNELDAYFRKLKRACNLNRNLTIKALRYAYFSRLAYHTEPAFSSLVFANTSFAKPTTLYYLSVTHEDVTDAFYNVTARLTHPENHNDTNVFAGVSKSIRIPWVKNLFFDLFSKLQSFSAYRDAPTASLILQHNQFVAYILLAIHLVAALRPSKYVVADQITLDLEAGLLYVSDKNVDAVHVSRLIPIPEPLIQQIKIFHRHLRWMAKKLATSDPDMASIFMALSSEQQVNFAKFSFIVGTKLVYPSTSLTFQFANVPAHVPKNILRHFFASNLPSQITHYRQYLLGHIVSGAHIYSSYNITPVRELEVLRGGLEQLLDNCDFSVYEVNHCRGKLKAFEQLPCKLWLPQKWLARIEMRTDAFKVLQAHMDYQYLRSLTELDAITHAFEVLQEDINQYFAETSNTRLHKAVNGMLGKFERFFSKTTSKALRARFYNAQKQLVLVNPMQVYHAQLAQLYKEMYQSFRADNELPLNVDFLFSIACYQPYLLPVFIQSEVTYWNIEVLKGIVVLSNSTANGIVINSFSALLLLKLTSTLNVELVAEEAELRKGINMLKAYCTDRGVQMSRISQLKALATFMLENDIYTHASFTRFDMTGKKSSSNLNIIDKRRLLADIYPDIGSLAQLQSDEQKLVIEQPLSSLKDEEALFKSIKKAFSHNHVTTVNNAKLLFSSVNDSWEIEINDASELLDFSKTLYPITRYLLEFTLSECQRIQSNGRPLAKGTITRYLRICSHLFKSVKNQDIGDWDVEEVEDMYAEIIGKFTNNDKESIAPDLYRFHMSVFKDTHIEHLDWIYIAKDSSLPSEKQNKSTIISGVEYQRARRYLAQHDGFTDDEKIIHEGIMVLSTKAGLRRAETSHLEITSINTDSWTAFIHSNGYFKTKSKNSNRQYHVGWLMTEDEKAVLNKLFAICTPHIEIKEGRAFLFLTNNASAQRIQLNWVFSNVTSALRFATGIAHVRIHDCRRTFINMQYLLFSNAYTHPAIKQVLQTWFGRDNLDALKLAGYEAITGRKEFTLDERITCGIAMAAGHHLETERDAYVMCADLIAYSHVELDLAARIKWPIWIKEAGLSNKQNKLPLSKIINRIIKQHSKVKQSVNKPPDKVMFLKKSQSNKVFDELHCLHRGICELMQINNSADTHEVQLSDKIILSNNSYCDVHNVYRVVTQMGFSKLSLKNVEGYSFPSRPQSSKSIVTFFYNDAFISLIFKSFKLKTIKRAPELFSGIRVNNKQQLLIQPACVDAMKGWLDTLGLHYTVESLVQKHNNIQTEVSKFSIVNSQQKQDLMINYLVVLLKIYNEHIEVKD